MNRSLQYLLIIFGVLLLLFFINQNQQSKYRISSQAIFEVDENDIHRFSMVDSNGDSLVLAKSDTSWYIPDADTLEMKDRQINQFFEKVVNGTFDMIVSKNPEKWDKFGVADSSGKKVTLYDVNNKSLSSVIFSNIGQDYSHNYYRKIGESEVLRTTENIFYMINTKATYWGSSPKKEESENKLSPVSPADGSLDN